MTTYLKMATVQEKAMCVCWVFGTKSVIIMQLRYRIQYGSDPPSDNAIQRWVKQFQETGSVLGRPSTSREDVDRIQEVWTSYVPREAHMLKLFSILQY
jgi:hypothetical protein